MKISTLYRITAGTVLVQIALGGLVTFDFIGPLLHIAWGAVAFAFATFTVVTTLRSGPTDGSLRGVSSGLVLVLLVQIALGMETLYLGIDALAWVHLILGVIIYAMCMSGMAFAMRQEYTTGAGAILR